MCSYPVSDLSANVVGFIKLYLVHLTTSHLLLLTPCQNCHHPILVPVVASSTLLFLILPSELYFQARWSSLKSKSSHVPPLLKILQRLPCHSERKPKSFQCLAPSAAFLDPSPTPFSPVLPCSSHLCAPATLAPWLLLRDARQDPVSSLCTVRPLPRDALLPKSLLPACLLIPFESFFVQASFSFC